MTPFLSFAHISSTKLAQCFKTLMEVDTQELGNSLYPLVLLAYGTTQDKGLTLEDKHALPSQ